ncbi:MAG: enoyl-CoA hydratase-related protein [Byssovorax sp.]
MSSNDPPAFTRTARPDGVVRVAYDLPGEAVNTLRPTFGEELGRMLDEIAGEPRVEAVILVSGKPDAFIAGADLALIQRLITSAEAEAMCRAGHRAIQRLYASRKPVVAAVHGAALGGGFEVALACQGRVLSDDPKTMLSLPEVKLGLLPGIHGLQRLAEKAGMRAALDHGLSGKSMRAEKALALGVADAVVPRDRLEDAAASLALRLAAGGPPFHRRPTPITKALTRAALEQNPLGRRLVFREARAELLKKTRGHYPAPEKILHVLETWAAKGFEASAEAEVRAAGELCVSSVAKRLIELFFAQTALKKEPDCMAAALDDRPGSFLARILAPLLDEMDHLGAEGIPADAIDEALLAWGFTKAPSSLRGAEPLPEPAASAKSTLYPEEIQMRCALRMVNEAVRCLGEGLPESPREGDVGAVLGLGFPPFRGGPFRYVDDIGPAEIDKRLRRFAQRAGDRFIPSPLLAEMAGSRRRFYP